MGNSASTPNQFQPAYTHDRVWPNPTDSVNVLQQKIELNNQIVAGEIFSDAVVPGYDGDVTEYQSNAAVAQTYINQKTSTNK